MLPGPLAALAGALGSLILAMLGRLLPVLLAGLLLSGCGQKPMLGVSTNDDNSISITADRAPKDSMGLGYLTVGENEQIVIDATGMDKGGNSAAAL